MDVACLIAGTADPAVTMTSALILTNSAAISAKRLVCPSAILDYDGAPLGPAHFTQPLLKGRGPYAPRRSRTRTQKPDDRQLSRLLRARRERPCSS